MSSEAANLELMEFLHARWQRDPTAVDASVDHFFRGFELGAMEVKSAPKGGAAAVAASDAALQTRFTGAIFMYRTLGHTQADINPLVPPAPNARLSAAKLGLNPADMDKRCDVGNYQAGQQQMSVKDLLAHLNKTYCGTVGVEYVHIQETHRRRFLQRRLEGSACTPKFDAAKKQRMLRKILNAELMEQFLHTHFVGAKRFSLEGGETLIAALDALVQKAPESNVKAYVLGMAHRGRLNVLTEVMGKNPRTLFKEFGEDYVPNTVYGSGDVKYHLGYESQVKVGEATVGLYLTPNPSHLEAVDPVVEGRARALQRRYNDMEKRQGVVPILVHGDAAFIGQGIVAETFNLSKLNGYTTGGTIHIAVNNQIGFTTDPTESRSSQYCSDMAKMVEAPVFHVNGDDPEAVIWAIELALDYRQEFGDDVVIDMLCYRRHGHNEVDEPRFTQPKLYAQIDSHPLISATYEKRLVGEGSLPDSTMSGWKAERMLTLEQAYQSVKLKQATMPPFAGNPFAGSVHPEPQPLWNFDPVLTGVEAQKLETLVNKLTTVPEGFAINPKIARLNQGKRDGWKNDKIDWGLAEQLAWGTLVMEGKPVRISGQDCVRGTFSHRHVAWFDVKSNERYEPINHLDTKQAKFCAHNSSLSEAAVLGFDFGYSLDFPEMLCMWEAQFGDFANGAQSIIDQYVVSSEAKWQLPSGLVMLLPHGYEGQGPEHSSARVERYLQLCAQENIQVVNPSTPAQLFHLMRRQMYRRFRKPLIVITPKSLLRLEACVSPKDAFDMGSGFREVLDDAAAPKKTKRVIVCCGKLYYELAAYRAANKIDDTAIVRVDQLYPFHAKAWESVVKRYGKATWVWAQEEPKNMGAWSHVRDYIQEGVKTPVLYAGRVAAASPAAGALALHKKEQAELIAKAFKA